MSSNYENDEDEEVPENAEDWDETDAPYGLKVEPERYIDRGIILGQQCLIKDNTREGWLQYCLLVDNIKTIAIASKKVTEDEIGQIKLEVNHKDNPILDQVDRANKILRKVIEAVISSKPIRKKLVLEPNKPI